jgi:uncharacterized protein involved in type VI secretion and phage assembly
MWTDPLIDLQHAHYTRVFGKYAGKVEANTDTENMGRLQVTCGAVLGDAKVWALPCVPYAGKDVGMYFIPPEGAGVWIEFEGGDVSRPIWTGCYWAKGDLPADAASADIKLIATAKVSLKIDDSAGEAELSNSSDSKTTWAADVATVGGKAKLTVAAAGVTSESAAGTGKVEVSDSGVSVNSGAFSVM